MLKVMRQMPTQVGREATGRGETASDVASDETCDPRYATQDTGSALLQAALTKENLQSALKRVRANKGAAGVDGLDIKQTVEPPGADPHRANLILGCKALTLNLASVLWA